MLDEVHATLHRQRRASTTNYRRGSFRFTHSTALSEERSEAGRRCFVDASEPPGARAWCIGVRRSEGSTGYPNYTRQAAIIRRYSRSGSRPVTLRPTCSSYWGAMRSLRRCALHGEVVDRSDGDHCFRGIPRTKGEGQAREATSTSSCTSGSLGGQVRQLVLVHPVQGQQTVYQSAPSP
jgi:hypothetical protein